MKKIILSVVLLTILCFTVVVTAETPEFLKWCEDIKDQHDGTTITVAGATHASIDAYQDMTSEFTRLTGIKVRWDTMNELQLRDKLMLDFAAGTGTYDVVMVDCVWVGEFAEKGVVIPLDEYLENSTYTPEWYDYEDMIPAYREGLAKWDGRTYGVVSAGQTSLLGYRTDLFEKYGIDPASIDSYDRVLELADFFNGKEPGLYGISMRGQRGHNIVVSFFTVMYPFGGRLFDDDWNVLINSEKSIEALEFLIELMQYAPPGVENYNSEEQCAAVARGDVALALDVSACPPYYEPFGSVAEGKMGYLAPPPGPEGDFAANAGWLLGISSNAKQREAAWAFMVYMTSKDKVDDFLAVGGDISRTSTFGNPDVLDSKPFAKPTLDALGKAYNLIDAGVTHWRPAIPEWSRIGEILGFEVNAAIIGIKSAEQALDAAAEQIYSLMKDNGYYD